MCPSNCGLDGDRPYWGLIGRSRRVKRDVELSWRLPRHRGVSGSYSGQLVHTRKGDLRCCGSLFCWCCCSAEAAAITDTPDGGQAEAWGSSGRSCSFYWSCTLSLIHISEPTR